jgi:hypothetical protein
VTDHAASADRPPPEGELLTGIHATDPGLFIAQATADAVATTFGFVLTVAGAAGTLPP